MTQSEKILNSKQEIMHYLQISKHRFKKLIAHGLPVKNIDNRYWAHKDNLDNFFKSWSNKKQ